MVFPQASGCGKSEDPVHIPEVKPDKAPPVDPIDIPEVKPGMAPAVPQVDEVAKSATLPPPKPIILGAQPAKESKGGAIRAIETGGVGCLEVDFFGCSATLTLLKSIQFLLAFKVQCS